MPSALTSLRPPCDGQHHMADSHFGHDRCQYESRALCKQARWRDAETMLKHALQTLTLSYHMNVLDGETDPRKFARQFSARHPSLVEPRFPTVGRQAVGFMQCVQMRTHVVKRHRCQEDCHPASTPGTPLALQTGSHPRSAQTYPTKSTDRTTGRRSSSLGYPRRGTACRGIAS